MHHSELLIGLVVSVWAVLIPCTMGCEGALSPKQTPQRAVINFLKDSGRGDLEAATERVTSESADQVESWIRLLYFPDISNPPTEEEEDKVDRFIGLLYRITVMEETETEATVHVVFSGTDAILEFPSVADDPRIPNVARFMLKLVRVPVQGEDGDLGEWQISSFEPVRGSS